MNIQELGSLGELIGAIAVLATLVYLSLQIRQARLAAEQTAKFAQIEAGHSSVDVYNRWRALAIQDRFHAEVLAKAKGNEELSESEAVVLSMVFQDLFFGAAFSHYNSSSGASFHEASADVRFVSHVMNEYPRSIAVWVDISDMLRRTAPEFVELLDLQITNLSNA